MLTFAKKLYKTTIMRFFKNPNITVALLAIYTIIVYAYMFPRNNEMSLIEKCITIGTSAVVLIILWFLLRKREKLRRERENDIKKKNN